MNGLKALKIFWFSYYSDSEPSVRYRALLPLRYLEQNESLKSYNYFPKRDLKGLLELVSIFCKCFISSPKNSIIVIQKVYSRGFYFYCLKVLIKLNKRHKLIYDIDDADYIKRNPSSINYFMEKADKIICGSESIKNHASKINPNTIIIGTATTETNNIKQKKSTKSIRLVWIGFIQAHFFSLKNLIIPALKSIEKPIEIGFIGINKTRDQELIKELFYDLKHVTLYIHEIDNWNDYELINKLIFNYDYGLAPLLNTEYNRAKSAFRLKQLLSNSLPVVGNITGEQGKILNNENGYACETINDFINAFNQIKNESEENYLKKSIIAKKMAGEFSLKIYSEKLLNEIKKSITDSAPKIGVYYYPIIK